jgi:multiple sugar transport system permease protein
VTSYTAVQKKQTIPRKKLARIILANIVLYTLALTLSLIFALPLIWLVSTSLKTGAQAFRLPPELIPNPFVFSNYINGLTFIPIGNAVLNTLLVAVPRILGSLVACSLVAYGFSCVEWDGRDTLFFICISTMVIPYAVVMIPLYIFYNRLGWVGTFAPLIVPYLFGEPYYIFLIRQFFMGIPCELRDAARVDGSSELSIFIKIILPLAKPVLSVVMLFQFMWIWSDYLEPLIFLENPALYTVSLALHHFGANWKGADLDRYPWFMAAITAATIPVLVLFFFVQRTFIEGISMTGLKG